MSIHSGDVVHNIRGKDGRAVNVGGSVVKVRIRGIDQQAALIDISAIGDVRVRKRLAPCVGKLGVHRFQAGAEEGLESVVV